MKKNKPIFNLLKKTIKVFQGKRKINNIENIPKEPCILVGNHAHSHGPFFAELFFPQNRQTWCAGEIMDLKTAPAYIHDDFWRLKPKGSQWFYKILSYIVAPLCVYVFKSADTIPVYRDSRGLQTFKQTVSALDEGNHVFIFPEGRKPFNDIVNDFQDKFVDVAKIYNKKTQKELNFVPFYIAPSLKSIYFGNPIKFDSANNSKDERKRICDYLKDEITTIAQSLPLHTVTPYANISKRKYPKNKSTKV